MSPEPTLQEALARIDELAARVAALEGAARPTAPVVAPRPVMPPFPPRPATNTSPAPSQPEALPEFIHDLWSGERLLALAGGVLVLAGAVFLLALAIGHGWLTPALQVALAIAGGAGLCGLGFFLHDRDEQYHVLAQVLAGAGGGAMYLGLTAGSRFYDPHVLSSRTGLVGAIVVGALLVALSIRWASQPVAGFGIVGAVFAPLLVDAPSDGLTLAFGGIALVAACAVIAERGWPWLVQCALWPTLLQLGLYFHDGDPSNAHVAVVAFAWTLLLAGAALARDVLLPQKTLRISTALTTFATAGLSALLVGGFSDWHHTESVYLLALAGTYSAAGALLRVRRPVAATVAIWLWTLSAAACGAAASITLGRSQLLAIGVVWLIESVALTWLSERTGDEVPRFAAMAAGGGAVLILMADPLKASALAFGAHNSPAFAASGLAVAAALFCTAYILKQRRPEVRLALERIGAGVLLYTASGLVVSAFAHGPKLADIDRKVPQNGQFALSLFWVALGLAAVVWSVTRHSKGARYAGVALLGLTAGKVLLVDTATLASGLRVLALVIVGGVLFAGSYLLSRFVEADGERETVGPQNPPEVFREPHRRAN